MTQSDLRAPCVTDGCREIVEVRARIAEALPALRERIDAVAAGVQRIEAAMAGRAATEAIKQRDEAAETERHAWESALHRWTIRSLLALQILVVIAAWPSIVLAYQTIRRALP